MPFCTSLPGHNPRYWDLVESLDVTGRNPRTARSTREEQCRASRNPLYARGRPRGVRRRHRPDSSFNSKLYYKHTSRQLVLDMGHVFIRGYEDDTVSIVEKLQEYASSGIAGYRASRRVVAG